VNPVCSRHKIGKGAQLIAISDRSPSRRRSCCVGGSDVHDLGQADFIRMKNTPAPAASTRAQSVLAAMVTLPLAGAIVGRWP
jgi:hypothetical protein